MSAEAAWVLGPFVFGAGVAIALGLFDVGSALREILDRVADAWREAGEGSDRPRGIGFGTHEKED
jgi:hypothetical protein